MIKYKQLSPSQRYTIECLLVSGYKQKEIAKAIGRSESTISGLGNWGIGELLRKMLLRIQRIQEFVNFGDCESVEGEIRELRIHDAKGYRVYLSQQEKKIVILLYGGIKTSQSRDIKRAQTILKTYKSQN